MLMSSVLAALLATAAGETPFVLDTESRRQVVEAIAQRLAASYVLPDIAATVAQEMRTRRDRGAYDDLDGAALARTLTEQLRAASADTHLQVHFSPRPLPPMAENEREETSEERERRRLGSARVNHGFLKVERLPGNLGFLDLDLFADPEFAGDTAAAAMRFLSDTDALIVDLRYCPGGDGGMVALLASYLFAEPLHLNDYAQRGESTKQSWTLPYVPGSRYIGKEVYLLTSRRTHSAAEEFAYDLQSLRRAQIVGEVTRGGAHTVARYRIHEHFGVQVPVGRAINPITGTNWQGKGVQPDLAVPADTALETAQIAALRHLLAAPRDDEHAAELQERVAALEKKLAASR